MDAIIANPTTGPTQTSTPPPSLLILILDTNPFIWDDLSSAPHNFSLLPTAISQLLLFINAHLAFSHENRVAVLASHCGATTWLYPSSSVTANPLDEGTQVPLDANKYRPFAIIEHAILTSLSRLLDNTTAIDLEDAYADGTAPIAGALTLALSYIHRLSLSLQPSHSQPHAGVASASLPTEDKLYGADTATTTPGGLDARILVLSASADVAAQYIPLMNSMFAAQGMGVPIDVLNLAEESALLQQCTHTTHGLFIAPAGSPGAAATATQNASSGANGTKANGDKSHDFSTPGPITLLPALFTAFLPSPSIRRHLNAPSAPQVDFRAACFCHQRIVDVGFVCSICLSIFCDEGVGVDVEKLGTARGRGVQCLTCGSELVIAGPGSGVGDVDEGGGAKKKKKKKRKEGEA